MSSMNCFRLISLFFQKTYLATFLVCELLQLVPDHSHIYIKLKDFSRSGCNNHESGLLKGEINLSSILTCACMTSQQYLITSYIVWYVCLRMARVNAQTKFPSTTPSLSVRDILHRKILIQITSSNTSCYSIHAYEEVVILGAKNVHILSAILYGAKL